MKILDENKHKRVLLIISAFFLFWSGCQKTPAKSAVVVKQEGIKKESVVAALNDGETQTIDVPSVWKAEEKKSNDRCIISMDINMAPIELGNIPVLEVKNHVMTQKELENLVKHFAGDEPLYKPEVSLKEGFRKIIERVQNKEGGYADYAERAFFEEHLQDFQKAIEIAPEEQPEKQNVKVEFQKSNEDKACFTAIGRSVPETKGEECFFRADVGSDAASTIRAENYDEKLDNYSFFSWEKKGQTIANDDLTSFQMMDQFSSALNKNWTTIQTNYLNAMNKEEYGKEEAEKAAEDLLKELSLTDMQSISEQKVLWFPKNTMPDSTGLESVQDQMIQTDVSLGQQGYEIVFAQGVNGVPIDQYKGSYQTNVGKEENYAPPFPTESIRIIVTKEGIVSFHWSGMNEQGDLIAENTKLLNYKDVQEKLFDQVYYRYTAMGQPVEDKTVFVYKVQSAKLGYTYVPAYNHPDRAWLVPTWFFAGKESVENKDGDRQIMEFMFDGLDGRLIGNSSN